YPCLRGDYKRINEGRMKRFFFFFLKAEGLFFHLVYCMFIYLKKNIFWKALNFCENHEKCWRWLATFVKNAGGERVKDCSLLKKKYLLSDYSNSRSRILDY
ncbi:MAG: hypothetical protein ACRCVV_18760, partial [Shewanella sp.]